MFEAVRGEEAWGDIAIDNIEIGDCATCKFHAIVIIVKHLLDLCYSDSIY